MTNLFSKVYICEKEIQKGLKKSRSRGRPVRDPGSSQNAKRRAVCPFRLVFFLWWDGRLYDMWFYVVLVVDQVDWIDEIGTMRCLSTPGRSTMKSAAKMVELVGEDQLASISLPASTNHSPWWR